MKSNIKWRNRYLQSAKDIAQWSKDPSRKIGAVVIGSKGQILCHGYNGFPRGIDDNNVRLNSRNLKYKYVVHAEMNAIFNATYAGICLDGATLYVYGLPICSECAKGIIQVGIKKVVMMTDGDDQGPWLESWLNSKSMFDEVGVEYQWIDKNEEVLYENCNDYGPRD